MTRRAFVLLAVSALAGCRSAPAGRSQKDTIVFATMTDALTLDPAESATNESEAVNQSIYEGLLAVDGDGRIVGQLAERWSVAPDGVTWTFYLRRGVRFHDGTPLDAAAVKRSFDRLLDPAAAHRNRQLVEMIIGVDAVGPGTITIATAFPFGSFEHAIASLPAGIVQPAAAAKWGRDYGSSAAAAIGTGPFKVVSWKKDLEIVLERNEDYWGDKPGVRRVVYRPVPDVEARIAALETGDVDVINRMTASAAARLAVNPDIVVRKQQSLTTYMLRFNCRHQPFTDPRVRRAISYAIDRRAIVEHLMPGMADVATGPLPPIMHNSAPLGEMPHDPEQARQLLREAGYPQGFSTRLMTSARMMGSVELAEVIAAQLKHIGIDVGIDVVEHVIFMGGPGTRQAASSREMYIYAMASSTLDADWGLRPRYTSLSPLNQDSYSNQEFDRLIANGMKAGEEQKRLTLYRRAQEILYFDDPPVAWLFQLKNVTAAHTRVQGLTLKPTNTVTFERAFLALP